MRSIAVALKRQRLRRAYPCGVHISNVIQRGVDTYYATLTNLKNGYTLEALTYTGYLAIVGATISREGLIAGFQDAGVKVETGFLSTHDKIRMSMPTPKGVKN